MSPIANDCLKLSIDGQVEPHLVPKLLLHVENHVSGDEPETLQKGTYAQVVTGNRIGNTDGT